MGLTKVGSGWVGCARVCVCACACMCVHVEEKKFYVREVVGTSDFESEWQGHSEPIRATLGHSGSLRVTAGRLDWSPFAAPLTPPGSTVQFTWPTCF